MPWLYDGGVEPRHALAARKWNIAKACLGCTKMEYSQGMPWLYVIESISLYMPETIRQEFISHIKVAEKTMERCALELAQAAEVCYDALKAGRKILLMGNGGSAADALHLAAEFTGRYQTQRVGLAAIALNSDAAALTSIGNDFGFDMVFSRQVEALGRKGDVCIGLSTSGHSANVIRGLERARIKGCKTIGFTGREGGDMPEVSDICIIVPSDITSRIQEMHLLMGHTLVHLVESRW
jgi:D-sedoheptulose 7-phosphate isomerase